MAGGKGEGNSPLHLSLLLSADPLSEHYVFPPGKTPKDLTRILLARQKAVFGRTILDAEELTLPIITRNMKLLLKKYPLEDVKRGIELSVIMGDHPASTKFIEEQILWLKELRNCLTFPQ